MGCDSGSFNDIKNHGEYGSQVSADEVCLENVSVFEK